MNTLSRFYALKVSTLSVFLLITLILQETVLLSCSAMPEVNQAQRQVISSQVKAVKKQAPLTQTSEGLFVKYNQDGPVSLIYNNHEYYGGEGVFNHAIYAEFQAPDGSTYRIGGPYPQKEIGYGNDITRTYENGVSIRTQYDVEEDKLLVTFTISNPPSNDDPIVNIPIKPFKLLFPGRPGGTDSWNWPKGFTIRGNHNAPPLIGIETEKAVIAITNQQITVPEILQIIPGVTNSVKSGLTEGLLTVGIHKEAPLLPGETSEMSFRLQFAPPGSDYIEVASEMYAEWQRTHPRTFNWPDRRPIGTEFLCRSGQLYNWPHNPRGWLHDPDLYIINDAGEVTEAGKAELKRRLFERADIVLTNLQEADAQAIIIWDIEGQEAPHPISYVGDPRLLGQTAPEMDEIADEYIQKFKDAGFKIGLTIGAPTYILNKNGHWKAQREVKSDKETVAELADKIAYAKKRWGVTLFYIDAWDLSSTVSAEDIQALHEIHPDVMLIPEWESYQWWAYSAPYRTRNLSESGTPPDVRAAFPDAFSVNQFDGTYEEQSLFYDWILEQIELGDVILFHSWYNSSHKHGTKHLYDEVKYRKQRNPIYVGADLSTLLTLAQSTNPAERYQAAEELGKKSAESEAVEKCIELLNKDTDWVVAKRASDALGQLADPAAIPYLKAKALEVIGGGDFLYWYKNHAYVATQALAQMGSIAALQEIINTPDIELSRIQYAIEALGKTGDSAAIPILVDIMNQPTDSDTSDVKVYVANALEKLPSDPSATSALINALQIELELGEKYCSPICLQNKEDAIKVESAKALVQQGKGNRDAIEALIDAYSANDRFSQKYLNNMQYFMSDALWKLTGEFKLDATASEWREIVYQAPVVPTMTSSEGGNQQLTLSWKTTGDYYTIKYGTSSGNYSNTIPNVTTLPYTIEGLEAGTVYYVVVQAHDENGDSKPSEEQMVMTSLPGDNIPPTGAAFWFDADDSTSLTIVEGKVTKWRDKSGNKNHLTQTVESLQPSVVEDALNGHSVIRFDRDLLSTADDPSLNFSDATIYVVVKATAISGWSGIIRKGVKNNNAQYLLVANQEKVIASVGESASQIMAPLGDYVLIYWNREGIFLNGEPMGGMAPSQFPITGGDDLVMGQGWFNTYFSGDIAEIIVYPYPLNREVQQKVESYLNNKWLESLR
ncbi:MAG: HEAT repeat domain-containing protein [Pseudomonadota bacterium]